MHEDGKLWSVLKPKARPTDKFHDLLCYLWEETDGGVEGLFAVFTNPENWKIIDSTDQGISLEEYAQIHNDWNTYRCDIDILDPDPDVAPQDKQIVRFENKVVQIVQKPAIMPTEQNPLVIKDISIVNMFPSIGSSIGEGDRLPEASTKPVIIRGDR
jgi:hypothetical protein